MGVRDASLFSAEEELIIIWEDEGFVEECTIRSVTEHENKLLGVGKGEDCQIVYTLVD